MPPSPFYVTAVTMAGSSPPVCGLGRRASPKTSAARAARAAADVTKTDYVTWAATKTAAVAAFSIAKMRSSSRAAAPNHGHRRRLPKERGQITSLTRVDLKIY